MKFHSSSRSRWGGTPTVSLISRTKTDTWYQACISRPRRDSRLFRACKLYALYSRNLASRRIVERYRQAWIQQVYQAHSSWGCTGYRTLEVCPHFPLVLDTCAWANINPPSFPYLVSINSVLPAIIAGNAVLFKPSPQTPLTAERFALALTRAGVPEDIIQVVHLTPSLTTYAVQHPLINFVSFTGSVSGGKSVAESAATAKGFTGVALEVRKIFQGSLCPLSAPLPLARRKRSGLCATRRGSQVYRRWACRWWFAIDGIKIAVWLFSGSFFNSGQSCCAVEVCTCTRNTDLLSHGLQYSVFMSTRKFMTSLFHVLLNRPR